MSRAVREFDSEMKVFVSYANNDGLDKARQAASVLKSEGHTAWVYEHSKTVGALVWREIANCIVNESDLVLYICTPCSLTSHGQAQEAGYALNHRKRILVISLDGAVVPLELTARTYEKTDTDTFFKKITSIAKTLPEIVQQIRKLDDGVTASEELLSE